MDVLGAFKDRKLIFNKVPVVVMGSKDDKLVPHGQFKEIYDKLKLKKKYAEVSGSHN